VAAGGWLFSTGRATKLLEAEPRLARTVSGQGKDTSAAMAIQQQRARGPAPAPWPGLHNRRKPPPCWWPRLAPARGLDIEQLPATGWKSGPPNGGFPPAEVERCRPERPDAAAPARGCHVLLAGWAWPEDIHHIAARIEKVTRQSPCVPARKTAGLRATILLSVAPPRSHRVGRGSRAASLRGHRPGRQRRHDHAGMASGGRCSVAARLLPQNHSPRAASPPQEPARGSAGAGA